MDVFKGQLTKVVLDLLRANNIFVVKVPANMTHLFKPLDLTVNSSAKSFMKEKFAEWYTQEIMESLEKGVELDDIEIKISHVNNETSACSWMVQLYDHLTSE